MKTAFPSIASLLALAILASPAGAAGEGEAKEQQELAAALRGARVPLDRGVSVASNRGRKAISARFELEKGQLQLSIYTVSGEAFSEVIVNHGSGKIASVEAITSGEDLAAAKAQGQAMAKAKRSLVTAIGDALKENPGYRAVSAVPRLAEGRPEAEVALLKGTEWKTARVKLDGK